MVIFENPHSEVYFARSPTTRGQLYIASYCWYKRPNFYFGRNLGDVPCPPSDGRRPNSGQPVPCPPLGRIERNGTAECKPGSFSPVEEG